MRGCGLRNMVSAKARSINGGRVGADPIARGMVSREPRPNLGMVRRLALEILTRNWMPDDASRQVGVNTWPALLVWPM